ncbi:hypothetical protein ACQP1G_29185 [Nocardia sp. CA-107356]|uniref:hypothetical protein n=1 Tax=Nocardia sp. CA-107356 TaxID=3239972 RepID=UPI003D93FD29
MINLDLGAFLVAPGGLLWRLRRKISPLLDPDLEVRGTPNEVVRERVRHVLGRSAYCDGGTAVISGWMYDSEEERLAAAKAYEEAGPKVKQQIQALGIALAEEAGETAG